ncbi:acyltransferase domain-containing protein [Vreelandella alkaliphila]|uniref:acyltransferase domain-containing protein n=1 Tax=Vreelandella alkaliphila TaxID=272774 RepID=UPI003FD7CA26
MAFMSSRARVRSRITSCSWGDPYWGKFARARQACQHFRIAPVCLDAISCSLGDQRWGTTSDKFFGFNERQARYMDPQNRLMLESSWRAFEHAGYAPRQIADRCSVGVFAGKNPPHYYHENVIPHIMQDTQSTTLSQQLEVETANGCDFVGNWLAYKIGFTGPALNIQTACSTGLSAVAVACQNLLTHYCDMALVSVSGLILNQGRGYLYQENNILSSDGYCRPLDADASGTLDGSGVVSLVLKRYEDAIEAGDQIHAVIAGVGINNDGLSKQDFMAPGVEGQARAIRMALAQAELKPDDIDYLELHGTGTRLGDPVELSALKLAWGEVRDRKHPCRLGSVKANIGHLNACAGLAGLVKVILAIRHHTIPPMANFRSLNPYIELDNRAFEINTAQLPWPREGNSPHRAGISSFGFGGTNVHLVVEEHLSAAASMPQQKQGIDPEILFASAASPEQIKPLIESWLPYRQAHGDANISLTSLITREHLRYRTALVLRAGETPDLNALTVSRSADETRVGWVFGGQGEMLSPEMGRQLYRRYAPFRDAVDECRMLLGDEQACLIWPLHDNDWSLHRPAVLQPALFIYQYALAQLWRAVGLMPECVLGHSIGEIAAVCVAGGLTLDSALQLVRLRGLAFESIDGEQGSMLVVFSELDSMPSLEQGLVVAAHNATDVQVVAGAQAALDAFMQRCQEAGVGTYPLNVTHAFHSPMVRKAADYLVQRAPRLRGEKLTIPVYSTLSGQRLEDATDIAYWARHLLSPTLFSEALAAATAAHHLTMAIEISPHSLVSGLVRKSQLLAIPSCSQARSEHLDFLEALASAYGNGLVPEATALFPESVSKVVLPGYPFRKHSLWINRPSNAKQTQGENRAPGAIGPTPERAGGAVTAATGLSQAAPNGLDEQEEVLELNEDDSAQLLALFVSYWETYLGLPSAVPDDDFFSYGGTSLTAIQIQEAVKRDLGVSISMSEFMGSRTPRKLNEIVCERLMGETTDE